jgi:hypothetical protein
MPIMSSRRRQRLALSLVAPGLAALLACSASRAKDLGAARRADLEAARSGYVAKSMAMSPAQRSAALAYIASIEPKVGAMSDAEFLVAVARIPAFADNAHDAFDSGDDTWWPDTRLPVKLTWLPDGLLVARAAPEYAALVGTRITRVEGLAPAQLLAKLHAICGGTEAYRRWNALWVVGSGGLLQALGVAASDKALRVELEGRDGKRQSLDLPYLPKEQMPASLRPTRLLSMELSADEITRGWVTPGPSRPPLLYQQQPDTLYRALPLPGLDALYVQLRSNLDEQGQKILPFLETTLAAAHKSPPRNLVLDLRFDVGGDISLSRKFLRELVGLARGRIFVLVSRYTFSAGIVSAAAVRHDGGSRVTIVGEDVGDRMRFWSEGEHACLPNSHYCLRPTTGLWDLEHGCKATPGCYGDQFDATAGSLRPQLRAPLTATAWLAGRDPAMEAVSRDLLRR